MKNTLPPILIPTFNNPTYLRLMLEQLKRLNWTEIVILDGGSTFPEMSRLLDVLAKEIEVIILSKNPGPRFFSTELDFYKQLPEVFCVSDPDLQFNSNLPSNFLGEMLGISEKFKIGKVGFALDISSELKFKESKYLLEGKPKTIREYEKQYWSNKVDELSDGSPVYIAPIDTTFAIYNKRYFKANESFDRALRVGGNYAAVHVPWLIEDLLSIEEKLFYKLRNTAGAYHEIDGLHIRLHSDYQDVINSFSWRITRPLRVIGRASSKLRRLVSNFFI